MKHKIQQLALAVIAVVGLTLAPAPLALAAPADQIGTGATASGQGGGTDLQGMFRIVANVLLFLIGAIAVIMLIVGGIRYVISQGDSSAVKQAKDTILYAVIGIIVAILSYAIVRFVVDYIR